jgi:hypothetical protein
MKRVRPVMKYLLLVSQLDKLFLQFMDFDFEHQLAVLNDAKYSIPVRDRQP